MITAYNKKTRQLTQVEHSHLLKPAADWVINPIIDPSVYTSPSDTWIYDPETTLLRAASADELDLDPFRVATAKRVRMDQLNQACRAEIVRGYMSSALSYPHWYDGELTDQLNLVGALNAAQPTTGYPNGLNMFIACRDDGPDGEKEYESHNPAQLRQVLSDGVAFRARLLQKFNVKCEQIKACARVSEVNAITW